MNKAKALQDASVGEFIGAKVDARLDAVNRWLNDDTNFQKAALTSAGVLMTLGAGAELAARRLPKDGSVKSALGRAGLRLATIGTAAGAGLAVEMEGWTRGSKDTKKKMLQRPRI